MKTSRFRRFLWLALFVLVLAVLSVAAIREGLSSGEGPLKRNTPEAPAKLQSIECLGKVDIEGGFLNLGPLRTGTVSEIAVHEGMEVSAGSVLLRLDDKPARLQVQQAEAGLQAAQAQLAQAEEAVKLHPIQIAAQQALQTAASQRVSAAGEELARKEKLYAQNLIGKEEMTASRDLLAQLKSMAEAEGKKLEGLRAQTPSHKVDQAKAEVARAKAVLEEAHYGLDQCSLRAPEQGSVLHVGTGLGEIAAPQKPVILFAPARPRIIRADVEQEFIHLVEVGQPAVARDEINPQGSWTGRVTRVNEWYSTPTVPQRMPKFTEIAAVECIISLDPHQPPLRIGRRMTVRIGEAPPSP